MNLQENLQRNKNEFAGNIEEENHHII